MTEYSQADRLALMTKFAEMLKYCHHLYQACSGKLPAPRQEEAGLKRPITLGISEKKELGVKTAHVRKSISLEPESINFPAL